MQKFLRTLTLMALLLVPWVTQAQNSWTVADGTTTHSKVPLDFYNCDGSGNKQAQMLYPASLLTEMAGKSLSAITFYHQNSSANKTLSASTWYIRMGETSETDLSAGFSSQTLTEVYAGNLVVSGGVFSFEFTTPYIYNGGNLVVEIQTSGATGNWFGSSNQGCYGVDNIGSTYSTMSSPNYTSFLPKTTFVKTPTCFPVTGLACNATSNSLSLSWTDDINSGATYTVYNGETVVASGINTTSYTMSNLTSNTAFVLGVEANCAADDASAWTTIAARTACEATTPLPYAEDFGGYSGFASSSYPYYGPSITPACWIYYSNGTNTAETSGSSAYYGGVAQISSTSYGSMEANNPYLYLPIQLTGSAASSTYIDYETARGSVKYAVLPAFAQALNGLQISFDYKMSSAYSASGAAAVLELGYVTGDDVETFVSMQSYEAITTTQHVVELNLSELAAQAPAGARLAFKFSGMHYGTATYSYSNVACGIDNILVEQLPSCTRVTDLTATNATTSSITLSWVDAFNTGATYTVSGADGVIATGLTATSYTVTGLTDNTEYTFSVVANCSATDASLETTITTRTACYAVTSFPWNEDFESYEAADFVVSCWENVHIEGAGSQIFKTNTSTQGTNATVKLQLPDMTSGTMTKLRLPLMNLPSNNYLFSIDVYRNATGTSYPEEGIRVFVSTNGEIDGATELAFISRNCTQTDGNIIPAEGASGWYTYELPIGISGNCYIILRGESKYGSSTYMDNFIVKEAPNCMKPTLLAAGTVTNNSITLSWNDNNDGNATYVVTDGEDVAIPASQISNLTATGVTITGLTANTLYSFKVKADCGGDYSDAVAISNIRTECDAMNLPWTCGFESEELYGTAQAEALPLCSHRWVSPGATSGTTYPYAYSYSSYAHEGSRSLYFYGTTTTSYPEVMALVLPAVNVTSFPMNGNRVKFYARMSSSSYNKSVYVYTTNDLTDITSATLVGQADVSGTTHTLYTVNLTGANASDAYVVLAVQRGSGALYLDDLTLETMPSCPDVTGVTATPNGLAAVVEWDASNNAATYTVELRQDETVVSTATVSGTTHTFTGLTMDEDYEVYVRANCGSEESPWSSPVALHIGYCVPNPSTVDGQGITNVSFGMGDEMVNNIERPTATPFYGNYTSLTGALPAGVESTVSITYATGSSTVYSYGTIIWVDFDNSMTFDDDEIVYTGTSAQVTDGTPQVLEATFTIPASTPLGNYRMRIAGADSYFDSYIGGNASGNHSACFSSTYAVAHDYTLHVIEAPTCMPVINVAVSDVTATGATISWTDTVNEASYTLYNMADNSVLASGITANTYTLSNLSPNTAYSIGVEANCTGANGSKVPVAFTTLQTPASLPYTTGFETGDDQQWTMVNGTNGWYIGPAATDQGNSIYISNDNGTSYAYSNSATTVSYAFRTVNFTEAGNYTFGFDWRCVAESNKWDYLYAWLAPATETFVAGTMPSGMSSSSMNGTYCPEGWIDLTQGAKDGSDDWNNERNAFEVTTPGLYNLVLMWRNDNSGGNGVPAAVDNIVLKAKTAFEPIDLTATNITSNSATLTWTRDSRNNGTETYTVANGTEVIASNISGNNYVVAITPNTDYNFNVVAVNGGENSEVETINLGAYEFPTVTGKMVCLTGTILNTYDNSSTVTIYRGTGDNLTQQASYSSSAYLTSNQTNYTESSNWPLYGPVTVVFVGENATAANTGVANLTATYACPYYVEFPATMVETANGAFTWTTPEDSIRTYTNHRTEDVVGGDITVNDEIIVLNMGGCDSINRSLQLTLHPDFSIALTDQFCEGTTYTVGSGEEAVNFTASAQQNVVLHTVNGADSVIVLDLQMNPSPVAYINNKANDVVNNFCDGFDLVLNARSNMEGVAFQWDGNEEITDAVRTVNPNGTAIYSLIAIDPTTGCQSVTPATLTVNTIAVPDLTITSVDEVCFGQSVTMTVNDANNVNASYRWSNNQTGNSITVTPNATTTFSVTATSETGNCVVTAEKTITVNPLPVVTVSTDVNALCANSTLTLSANPGLSATDAALTYLWSTGATSATTTTNPTVSGNYSVTVTDENGCSNEFTTANVTVYPVYELNAERSACQEMLPITWGSRVIDAAGNFDQTFQTVNGCDSLVHLTFSIEAMPTEHSYAEYCEGTVFTFGGEQYTASNSLDQVSYVDNSNTCPVNMIQHLTVHPVRATTVPMTACDNYTWNLTNETYSESGNYDKTLATVYGCDSVVTLALTVNYQNTGIDVQTACDQFVWNLNGETYTASTNEPTVTLEQANALGCDSVVTLNLTVNYKSFYTDNVRECNSTTYTWIDGETYNLSVTPDDNVTFTLDVNNAAGCDSIAILNLTMNPVLDTLNWVNVTACDNYYIDVVTCEGDIVREYISESGDYIRRTRNAETGRDRMSRIHLTISNSDYQTIPVTACVPYDWQVSDNLVIAGINPVANDTVISQELQTEFGCNLIKVLRLHALRHTENVTELTLCKNGSWTDGNEVVYNMSDYELGVNDRILWNTTTNVAGCDSTDYVVFTVNPVYNETASLTLCENEFVNNAYTLANANNSNETVVLTIPAALNESVYTSSVVANWTTAAGCDSVVTISYTVNPIRSEEITEQRCYSFLWNDSTYTASGDYTFNTQTADGCDSTAILHLTIADTVEGEVIYNACGEYEWQGVIYRESRSFRVVEETPTVDGCDSVTIHTFNLSPRVMRDHYVTTNIPYTWHNGVTYTANADNIYYDATEPGGCDSVLVLHLTMLQDTAIVCEDQAPYTIAEGITIDYIYKYLYPFNFEDIYQYTNLGYGELTTFYWRTDFTAGMHDGATKLFGANLYTDEGYMPEDGIYNMNVLVNGTSVATKSFVITEGGYHNMLLDTPIDITNGDNVSIIFSALAYYPCFTARLNNPISNCTWSVDGEDWYYWSDGAWYFSALFNNEDGLDYGYLYTAGTDMQDTIIYYVVKHNSNEEILQTACDSYTWSNGNGMTYTESGVHVYDVVNGSANGCDSTATLVLTVNQSTSSNTTVTNCDSYDWSVSGQTYTESGLYTYSTTNAANCTHIDTLNLTINVNPGVIDTVVACDGYEWNGQTLTTSGDYNVTFTDANGCQADSVLHLTANASSENDLTVIRNEASTYYNGNYYPAQNYQGATPDEPYQFDVTYPAANAQGCDSVDHVTLYVTRGVVFDTTVNMCDQFTWYRNGNTYAWIPEAERLANGNALYKDVTNNTYIHTGENPVQMVLDNNGIATTTYVLWLNLAEANHFTYDLGTILLSQTDSVVVNPGDSLDNQTIYLADYKTSNQNATLNTVVEHTSTWYCKNIVTYTANLVWNYDTIDAVTICDTTSYTDPTYNVTFSNLTKGTANHRDFVVDSATANEMWHHIVINVTARTANAPQVISVCDTYTWTAGDSNTYITSGIHTWKDNEACTIDTLDLTIRNSNTGIDTLVACDSLTWIDSITYTASNNTATWTLAEANTAGCDSTVTLNLTINVNDGMIIRDVVYCDSYDWNAPDDSIYHLTETQNKTINYSDDNGCVGPATLQLVINKNLGIFDTVEACNEYTWTYTALNEYTGNMEDSVHVYTGSAASGDKSELFLDANGCEGYANLHLTIHDSVNTASERYAYGNGYTFHNRFYTPQPDGSDSIYTIIYDTVDAFGCHILDTMTLHVSQYVYYYTNKVECGSYTWPDTNATGFGNGHTYRSLTDEEMAAFPFALYYDVTDDTVIYSNPRFYSPNSNRVDELHLTLNRPSVTVINDTVLKSQLIAMSYNFSTVDGTINCASVENTLTDTTVTREFSLGPHTTCDSIVRYNINVVYNYYDDDTVTLCHNANYTVAPGDSRTLVIGNNEFTYTLNAGTATEEIHTVVVVNNDYTPATPQVVEVCDSYTWTAGDGLTYTTSGDRVWHNDNTCVADTLKLTVKLGTTGVETMTVCDSTVWNGTTYYASNNADTMMLTNAVGCDSVVTLNLTVNYSTTGTFTMVACDSYSWNGTTYTESNTTDTMMLVNAANCDSVVTLNLTINAHQDNDVYDTACVTYTWVDNNNAVYTNSGNYTRGINDANNCAATETLHLVINQPAYDTVQFWFGDGSYRYTGIYSAATNGQLLQVGDYTVNEIVAGATADGCDSLYNITLHVGNNYDTTESVRSCNSYTWARNGHTYVRLSDEQSAAFPTAIYFDETADTVVYYNPVVVEPRVNDFADAYMLDLTLDAIFTRDSVVNVPVSQGSLLCDGRTYNFGRSHDEGRLFIDTTIYDTIHIAALQYCDSIVNLTVNVYNNYDSVGTDDVCYSQTSYTWEGQTITLPADADNFNTLYVYNTVGDRVQYMVVNQHPIQYTTERRTECDRYEWNGHIYTESTSNATVTLADQFGCDSTVTLTLTLNHNTNNTIGSATEPFVACNSYEWTLGNGTVLENKLTESGMFTYDYQTAEGCPSHDTLYLTVNHSSEATIDETSCGTYTWMNGTETVGTYTTSGVYNHTFSGANAQGCDSTVTMNLTVYPVPATVYDAPDNHVCDTFFWIGQTWNGTEMVDTLFATITESSFSLTAYAVNENGCQVPHFISAVYIDKSSGRTEAVACDSYLWNGQTYTESGEYVYTSDVVNACGNVIDSLYLTINKNTSSAFDTAICNGNMPAGGFEWNGNYYTTAGVYTFDYTATNGCPSTDTLNLTIGTGRTFNRIYVEHCGPYTWNLTGETFDTVGYVEASTIYEDANSVGCDSVVYLYLTIHEQPVVNETDVVCDGELPYTWRGLTFTAAGIDTARAAFSEHCDSLFIMNLTVNERTYSSMTAEACDSYTWNGQSYNNSGVYTYTTTNGAGCDNIDTLHLTVKYSTSSEESAVACDNYEWNGSTYTTSGVYTFNTTNAAGCDSVATLTLTVNTTGSTSESITVCDSYTWNGEVYDTTGIYTYKYEGENGCQIIATLNLTIKNSTTATIEQTACDSYDWYGTSYNEDGIYTHTISNVAGCDSVITLKLTVNNSSEAEFDATACNYYTWTDGNGMTYFQSGDYGFTTPNAGGCDSVVTLHLTINAPVYTTIDTATCGIFTWYGRNYEANDVIVTRFTAENGCDSIETVNFTYLRPGMGIANATACDSYTWDATGETYTTSGSYSAILAEGSANGCDSIVFMTLTINHSSSANATEVACDSYEWNGTTYDATGVYAYEYTSIEGCPSVDSLFLTVKNSVETSFSDEACNYYLWNANGYNQSGIYTQTFEAANGCDSVVTLNLTINTQVTSSFDDEACVSYTWNGSTYNASGAYVQHFNSVAGCDSVVTLNLTIKDAAQSSFATSVCTGYEWNDITYTAPGVYTQTFTAANGCDSVVTLNLSFNNAVLNTINVSNCDSYTWNGQTYNTTGIYSQTFTAASGCDSIVTMNLTITNNGGSYTELAACNNYTWYGNTYSNGGVYTHSGVDANGCTGIDTLVLTILTPTSSTTPVTACVSYNWNGQTYNASGSYNYTTVAANGCDSVATLVLTINQPVSSLTTVSACNNYTWNGQTYATSGNYNYTTVAANGCDSVATLALTINQPKTNSVTVSACNNYTWNGNVYSISGDYNYTTTAANGCDSVVTLHLTINQPVTGDAYASACGSYTWEGTTYNVSGNHSHTYTASNGCDSVVTLHLTINQPVSGDVYASACSSYSWENATYTLSGNYSHTYTASNGCDSVVTLHLTINQPVSSSFNQTACSSFTWEGNTYTTSGNYTHTYTAANGCDSVVTMVLTINQPVSSTIYATACDSYTWDGNTYVVSGNYTQTYTAANNCDSVVTLVLTVNNSVSVIDEVTECDGYIWIDNVNYTESTNTPTVTLRNYQGCDSVVTLHLVINHSVEVYDSIEIHENELPYNYYGNVIDVEGDYMISGTTVNGCDSTLYLHVGVIADEPISIDVTSELENITVYPNPTLGQSTVTADDVETIEVFDIVGHLVAKFENTNRIDISNLAAGSYTLRINTTKGTAVRRLIKK